MYILVYGQDTAIHEPDEVIHEPDEVMDSRINDGVTRFKVLRKYLQD